MRLTDRQFAALLMAPAAIFLTVFVGYPLLRLVYDSLFDARLLSITPPTFVGLDNYVAAIASPRVQAAAWRTVTYAGIAVSLELLLGMGVALLFDAAAKRSRLSLLGRTIFAVPLMIAPIVAGLLWRYMLIDGFGILNHLLARFGIIASPDAISWLANPDLVLFSVIIADVWLTTSFVALVFYAGLQTIPRDMIEAARVDGANAWQSFRRITLPVLRPIIAVVLVIRGIDAARVFDVIFIQTEGGPQSASEVLSLNIYREMVRFGDLGYASAIATLFMIVMLVIALAMYFGVWRTDQMGRRR